MARLYTTGLELNHAGSGAGVETTSMGQSGGAVSSVVTTPVRSGTYGAKHINTGASGVARLDTIYLNADSNNKHFARIYFRVADLPDAQQNILFLATNAGTLKSDIRINTDATLTLHNGAGTQIGSASSALSLNTWYRVELSYRNDTANTDSDHEAKLDGTTFASTTTDATVGGISRLFCGGAGGGTAFEYYVDDIAVNDDQGSFENSWPGEGEVIHLRPDAAGDNAEWDGGTGTSYTEVDEIAPDDATTRIATDDVTNDLFDVNIADTPAALASDDVINCVAVGFRHRVSATTGSEPQYVARIKATSGGTVEESAALTNPNNTTWNTNNGNGSSIIYRLVLYDLPGASTTAWTKADLDTAQIGVRLSTADAEADDINISTLWLLVDHKPSAVTDPQVNVSDSIAISESVAMKLEVKASVSDAVAVTESLLLRLLDMPNISDAVSVTENVIVKLEIAPSTSDSIAVADTPNVYVPFYLINISDSISVAESVTSSLEINLAVSDAISLAESVGSDLPLTISVSDAITIVDTPSVYLEIKVSGSENIAVTESITVTLPVGSTLLISVSDSISVSESVQILLIGVV